MLLPVHLAAMLGVFAGPALKPLVSDGSQRYDGSKAVILSRIDPAQPSVPRQIEFPKPIPPPKPIESSVNALTNLPLRMLVPGVFELGSVRMDKRQRTLSFPATLNMERGPLEYVLVTQWGKTHESALRTEVEPFQIHVAMLLLADGSGAKTNTAAAAPAGAPGGGGQFISKPSSNALPGERVTVEVSWLAAGKKQVRRAEELVFNVEQKSTMTNAVWVYNGSRVWDGKFMAQLSGSIISLVSDPDSQVNSLTPGHDNDRIWNVNTNDIPAVNTPVQVTFKLLEAKEKP